MSKKFTAKNIKKAYKKTSKQFEKDYKKNPMKYDLLGLGVEVGAIAGISALTANAVYNHKEKKAIHVVRPGQPEKKSFISKLNPKNWGKKNKQQNVPVVDPIEIGKVVSDAVNAQQPTPQPEEG
jgi:hypothetical protein